MSSPPQKNNEILKRLYLGKYMPSKRRYNLEKKETISSHFFLLPFYYCLYCVTLLEYGGHR